MSRPGPGAPPPPPPFAAAPGFAPPLPPGWTEHRAPAGQPYWFNPQTNVSTYTRPLPMPMQAPTGFAPPPQFAPPIHFSAPAPAPVAPVKEKKEKPKTKTPIAGTDWIKVETNKGNVFWTNAVTKESVWSLPGEIKDLVKEDGGKKRERDEQGEEVKEEEGEEGGSAVKEEPEVVVAVEVEPPKKKKQKQVVMRELADLNEDEEWQRSVAAQMAAEVEAEAVPDEEKPTVPEPRVEPAAEAPVVQSYANSRPRPLDVSPEEGVALFKAMLLEKDIAPMAPWDTELTKFINDPRYLAVKTLRQRRDLFDDFCKEKLREMRAAKKAAQEGGQKVDPLSAFRALLYTAVTSTRTHFSDFKRTHSKDPRFREFGKTEGEREKAFKGWLRELGERKRAEANKAEERFVEMLREDSSIKEGDNWMEVKLRHVQDPRYEAVTSSSLRESLFTKYLPTLSKSSGSNPDKATRAMASLREREEQVRMEKLRTARNTEQARGAMGREEGEREFKMLLIDVVRGHDDRWESALEFLEKDPRFQTSNLNVHDKRRLFDGHLIELYSKRVAGVESLFAAHAPSLTTPFTAVLPDISSAPQIARLVGTDFDKLESLYDHWSKKRLSTAREEFDQLLRESPVLEHWGRMAKTEVVGGEEVVADEEEDGDDVIDLKDMAKQVDLKAIHAVLKHDKRYLIFNHDAENRNEWIKEYVARLEPQKTTVHQSR